MVVGVGEGDVEGVGSVGDRIVAGTDEQLTHTHTHTHTHTDTCRLHTGLSVFMDEQLTRSVHANTHTHTRHWCPVVRRLRSAMTLSMSHAARDKLPTARGHQWYARASDVALSWTLLVFGYTEFLSFLFVQSCSCCCVC